ncbi:MAG: hypothetical protein ACMUIE_00855 [Thermoplasmatota archaeon]
MVLRGIGFCPGHITGFFSIHDCSKDVLRRGSRGAGVNLSLGALSSVVLRAPEETGSKKPLSLKLAIKGTNDFEQDPRIYGAVLESLLPERGKGWEVQLRINLQLPVGQGFGMSGAGALSTAVAVWEAIYSDIPGWDRKLRFKAQQENYFSMDTGEFKIKPLKRRLTSHVQLYTGPLVEKLDPVKASGKASGMMEEGGEVRTARRWLDESQANEEVGIISYKDLVASAHRADILIGGGLGDVVAQARGGIEMRLAPGIPPYGEVHTIPVNLDSPPSVAFLIVGEEIKTSDVLKDTNKRKRINEAGETALGGLIKDPSPERMLQESSQFSRLTKLQNMTVKGALMEVQDILPASQIMIGNSVFAFVGGHGGASAKKRVLDIWKKRGDVQVCEIDLMGARPVN